MTCTRTQGFLAKKKVKPVEVVNAKQQRMSEKDALALAASTDEIWAAKGKRIVHLDLRSARASSRDILAVLLGPTGNLRAPTLRIGRTLIVGYDEATYSRLFR
jgi:arsenate reductase-like glutaredoxin family protein